MHCTGRALAACFVLLMTTAAAAQEGGALSGRVTNPAGAAVAGAAVTAVASGTAAVRGTVSDAGGRYQFAALPAGTYQLRAHKPGFAATVRSGVELAVGQQAIVNLGLRLGAASQQVEVRANAPLVAVTTTDISGLVGTRQIQDLPLNGRSYDELLTLNPGVVNFTAAKTGGVGVSNSSSGNNFVVAGNRPQQNLYLLNGVEFTGAAENNMQPGGASQQLLGAEAVAEFNLLADSYGAEYGKRPGAQVLLVTQSGSNTVHGSAYEYLRNNALDARNFFDPAAAPGFERNQFGAALGAPIAKNKSFLFVNYEGLRQHLHQTGVDLVPDANARLGLLPCALVSPAPAVCPASGLVPVGTSPWLAAWPAPSPGAPDFGGIAEAFNSPLQSMRDDFATARLDQVWSARDSLSAVYTLDDSGDLTPTSTNLDSTDRLALREQVASLEETHVLSPDWLNTVRLGFSRAGYFFTGEPTPGTPAAALPGFLLGAPVVALVVGGSAASNPAAQLSLAGSNNGSDLQVARNLFTYEDRLAASRGRQQLSAGVWFQRLQSNERLALSQYGQANFASLQALLQGTMASLLYTPAPTPLGWRSWFSAGYVQDAVAWSPRLTTSLGLRVESSTGWNEAHGRAATYTFPGGVISTQPSVGNAAFTVNQARFLPQPRLGVAWSPWGRRHATVVRAGFGLHNDLQDALGYRTDQNAPFNAVYSLPNVTLAQLPIVPSAPAPAAAKLSPGGVQPDLRTPTLVSWSLRLEQQLAPNTAFTAGYVGSHGYHEMVGVDANEPRPVVCPAAPCPAVYPANFPAGLANQPVPAGVYYVPSAVRANPALANTWSYFSEGDSSYNALQAELNHRMAGGLALRAAYTWAKTLDDGDSPNATLSGGEPALVSNPFDLAADRGLANFDVRHAASASAVYALPFGPGGRFALPAQRLPRALLQGWTADAILTLQSGFPFTPQLSYNPSNNGDTRNPVRPFLNPAFHGPVILGSPSAWFNPAAFLAPPPASGFYGDVGRDTLTGPGLADCDLSLLKEQALREGLDLQLRIEVFNLLNRANLNTPNAVVFTPSGVSPSAGVVTGTSTTSRQVQLALKLLW